VLLLAGAVVGISSPAQAAADPDGTPTPTVRLTTTEQLRAMAASGHGKLITIGSPAAKGRNSANSAVAAATVVTCYLDMSLPYGGGSATAHIYLDGVVYCDDYFHLGVLTVELYRGADRVANRTVEGAYVPGLFATAEYGTCTEGWYVGVVGATLTRFDLTPPTISDTIYTYPIYIGCGPPPPPPSAPLAVTNPGNQTWLELTAGSLQMTATGGTRPYTWSATGLPTGMSINASTGLISGAARAGGYAVTVTVTDAGGRTASTQFTWAVVRDRCPRC
jgi:hypothetical protein